MRTGIIQTRGLGDIVIAAPIAMHFIEKGHEVYWPIDSDFIDPFSYALPEIKFIPVDKSITGSDSADFFIEHPKRMLADRGCQSVHILYSFLTGYQFGHVHLANSLTFDAYKYAVSGVPFEKKWTLKIRRNPLREAEIFNILNINPSEKYSVIHENGSNYETNLSEKIEDKNIKIIKISNITDNFLDWLGVIENSSEAHLIDSVYSNIVDQLGFEIKKYYYPRSNVSFTPVMRTHWHFGK